MYAGQSPLTELHDYDELQKLQAIIGTGDQKFLPEGHRLAGGQRAPDYNPAMKGQNVESVKGAQGGY